MAVRVCAYGSTGVACMCTVQTTTAVQQAALHRAAPSPSSQHACAPTSSQTASQLLFPPSRHFTNQTSIVNSIETTF